MNHTDNYYRMVIWDAATNKIIERWSPQTDKKLANGKTQFTIQTNIRYDTIDRS